MSGFSAAGVVVANGTVSNFTATSGTTYTFDVTPSAAGTVTVSIPAGRVATDAAGKAQTPAASTPVSLAFTRIDGHRPDHHRHQPDQRTSGRWDGHPRRDLGFTGATAVIFGINTADASFVVNSDTQITVTRARPGPGIVPVTVTRASKGLEQPPLRPCGLVGPVVAGAYARPLGRWPAGRRSSLLGRASPEPPPSTSEPPRPRASSSTPTPRSLPSRRRDGHGGCDRHHAYWNLERRQLTPTPPYQP